jgi:hypothetical protein
MMKRACVARQNWQWREARRSQYVDIDKTSDKASDDSGRNPLRAGAILARVISHGAAQFKGRTPATFPAPPKL